MDDSVDSPVGILHFGEFLDRLCYPEDKHHILSAQKDRDYKVSTESRSDFDLSSPEPMKSTKSTATASTAMTFQSSFSSSDDSEYSNDDHDEARYIAGAGIENQGEDVYNDDNREGSPGKGVEECKDEETYDDDEDDDEEVFDYQEKDDYEDDASVFRLDLPHNTPYDESHHLQYVPRRNHRGQLIRDRNEQLKYMEMAIERSNTMTTESSSGYSSRYNVATNPLLSLFCGSA